MTTIEERSEYLKNPFFEKHIYGDWSPFYKTITVCMVFIVVLLVLNLLFGCVSKYKDYWQDRNTGMINREIVEAVRFSHQAHFVLWF